jgi:hypothetical protein
VFRRAHLSGVNHLVGEFVADTVLLLDQVELRPDVGQDACPTMNEPAHVLEQDHLRQKSIS